jgi:hypothetical protein
VSRRSGKDTESRGRTREDLPSAGGVKNDTAGLRAKGNLRAKRLDPSHRANAPPTAVADPALSGEDAYVSANVSSPGPQAGGATTSRSGLRGLTQQSSGCKALDGPAIRPKTPLAVESSVGKPAAPVAPNAGMGKRARRC